MDATDHFASHSPELLQLVRTIGADDHNWVTVAVLDPAIILAGSERSPATDS